MYNSDKPIEHEDEDLLGRITFVDQLAESITTLSTTGSFVVGLFGEWGSGKTSVINLTEKAVKQSLCDKDKRNIRVIRFNPWGYVDGSQLMGQFFSALSSEFQYDKKVLFQASLGEAIEDYAFALEFSKYLPKVGLLLRPFLPAIRNFTERAGKAIQDKANSKKYDVLRQKKCVEDILKKKKIKLVVFIDDLDRLPNEQIRMIFQLVNSVANFPNSMYILSFDYAIVCRALATEQNCKGEEYLEKIIQFPISLPLITAGKVHDILISEIRKVFHDTNQDLFDRDHWYHVLHKCILPFVRSLRDVRRYINALYFKYIPLKNNINPSDFAGLIALEVFEHQIYEWIRSNKVILTKSIEEDSLFSTSNRKLEKESWSKEFKEKCISTPDVVLNAIIILFPMYASKFDMPFEALDSEKFVRQLRISGETRFDAYFTLYLGDVSLSYEVRRISYTELNRQELNDYIDEIINRGLSREYLRETLISIDMISEDRKILFVESLYNKLSLFSKYDEDVLSYSGYSICLSLLSELLIGILNEQTRTDIFQSLIKYATEANLFATAQLIHHMEVALGRFGSKKSREDKIVIHSENIESIEQCFMSRINTLPDQSRILHSEHLIFIDYLWKNIDVQGYTDKMKLLLSIPKNMLLYTANKAQRILSMFEGTISWTFDIERDFANIISVSDVLGVIASDEFRSLLEGLSLEMTTKIAAFYLYVNDAQPNPMKSISNNDAEELALSWIGKQ